MIDIKLIRENRDLVKENIKKKFQDEKLSLVDEVYDLEILIARISFGNANGRDMLQLKNSLKPLPNIKNLLYKVNNQSINTIIDQMGDFTDIVELFENAISEDAPITIKEGGTQVVENIMQTLLIVSSALLGISSVTSIWKGNKTAIGKYADHKDEHIKEQSDEIE